jgi:pantoate--beta-alanine ligase
MQISRTIPQLRTLLLHQKKPAFVPTMGNLHQGHIRLIDHAKTFGDCCVASIFVNRLQFLPHEDFNSYPRTWEADCAKLEAAGCDIVFAPGETDLYPEPQTVKVHPDAGLGDILEGEFRPGFFTGVSTVVMKLFLSVFFGKSEGVAVFGKKDYQQLLVIQQLVRQFALPIEVVGIETCRADDGLALSSRNGYLNPQERLQAAQLSIAIRQLAAQAIAAGANLSQQLAVLEKNAAENLRSLGWQPDYLVIRRRRDLQLPDPGDPLVVLAAARLGSTRLIDNLEI